MKKSIKKYRSKTFNYNLAFDRINFRKSPERYQIGIGEQGVLLVEPYKSEILPHWRFKTEKIAKQSALKIYKMFLAYVKVKDFVGMDMARKFLQMGYTRARRYANHPSGKKYKTNPQKAVSKSESLKIRKSPLPQAKDWGSSEKARAARIFYAYYLKAKVNKKYLKARELHLRDCTA